jgi:hypothetical protein
MLDRALAKTFATFSTLFLVACLLTVPLHEVHAYIFKDALAIRELAQEVSAFPEGRQLRGVDRSDIEAERTWLVVLLAAELALTAIVFQAGRRVIAVTDEGGVPGVLDAYKHVGSTRGPGTPPAGPVIVGIAFGSVCAWLVWKIGELAAEVATPDTTWAAVGLARGVAVGTFMALAAGTAAALAPQMGAASPPPTEIDVY